MKAQEQHLINISSEQGVNMRNVDVETLVTELELQSKLKEDFILPSGAMRMEGGQLVVDDAPIRTQRELNRIFANSGIGSIDDRGTIVLNVLATCHDKMAEKLDIPKEYYNRMRTTNPSLLDASVTSWLRRPTVDDKKPVKNYMLRTFAARDGQSFGVARSLVSDRFATIDNYEILMTALKTIKDAGINAVIDKCDITDRRFYVRFICPDIEADASSIIRNYKNPETGATANGCYSGFVISNSEVGYGGFTISPRAILLVCKNGLTRTSDTFRRTHLGIKMDPSNINWSLDTRKKYLALIQAQVRDAINTFATYDYVSGVIEELTKYTKRELKFPVECVKNVCSSLSLSESEKSSILAYFVRGADTSHFGVAQALTYFAHQTSDAENQYNIESKIFPLLENMGTYDRNIVKKSKKISVVLDEEESF